MPEDTAAKVRGPLVMFRQPALGAVAVYRPLELRVMRVAALDEPPDRPTKYVVLGSNHELPAVPAANRLARDVVERPSLSRFHAGLVHAPVGQVVVVAHHRAAERVDHFSG